MFQSLTIIMELALNLAKVILR